MKAEGLDRIEREQVEEWYGKIRGAYDRMSAAERPRALAAIREQLPKANTIAKRISAERLLAEESDRG